MCVPESKPDHYNSTSLVYVCLAEDRQEICYNLQAEVADETNLQIKIMEFRLTIRQKRPMHCLQQCSPSITNTHKIEFSPNIAGARTAAVAFSVGGLRAVKEGVRRKLRG